MTVTHRQCFKKTDKASKTFGWINVGQCIYNIISQHWAFKVPVLRYGIYQYTRTKALPTVIVADEIILHCAVAEALLELAWELFSACVEVWSGDEWRRRNWICRKCEEPTLSKFYRMWWWWPHWRQHAAAPVCYQTIWYRRKEFLERLDLALKLKMLQHCWEASLLISSAFFYLSAAYISHHRPVDNLARSATLLLMYKLLKFSVIDWNGWTDFLDVVFWSSLRNC